jgi:hypothetical protein
MLVLAGAKEEPCLGTEIGRICEVAPGVIRESCENLNSGSRGIAPEYELATPTNCGPQYQIPLFGPRRNPGPDRKPVALLPSFDEGQDLSARLCPGSAMAGHTLPRLSSILPTLLLCGSGIGPAACGIAGSEKGCKNRF